MVVGCVCVARTTTTTATHGKTNERNYAYQQPGEREVGAAPPEDRIGEGMQGLYGGLEEFLHGGPGFLPSGAEQLPFASAELKRGFHLRQLRVRRIAIFAFIVPRSVPHAELVHPDRIQFLQFLVKLRTIHDNAFLTHGRILVRQIAMPSPLEGLTNLLLVVQIGPFPPRAGRVINRRNLPILKSAEDPLLHDKSEMLWPHLREITRNPLVHEIHPINTQNQRNIVIRQVLEHFGRGGSRGALSASCSWGE